MRLAVALVIVVLCAAANATSQPLRPASTGPWGLCTSEWKARSSKDGKEPIQRALEPNGDTTLVYEAPPTGFLLVRFDADGLYSIRNLILVEPSDGPKMYDLFDHVREELRAANSTGRCELTESSSTDSTARKARLSCADSLSTTISVENATKDGRPCVVFVYELTEGDRVRDRRRKQR